MKSLSGSQLVVQYLANHNIKYAFLVPGYLIDPLLHSLSDCESITPIICNSELASGYIADGYARASNYFSLCLSTGGPGATNLTTAVFNASQEQSKILFITGNVISSLRHCGGFQDLETTKIFRSLASYSIEIEQPKDLIQILNDINSVLESNSSLPLHLSIPLDIQQHHYLPSSLITKQITNKKIKQESLILDSTVNQVLAIINQYPKICILVGQRLRNTDDRISLLLLKLVEKYQITIATTSSAKGIFLETHPLSLGTFSLSGHLRAKQTLFNPELEVLLLIGLDFNEQESLQWDSQLYPPQRLVVRIDERLVRHPFNVKIDRNIIVSDCYSLLEKIVNHDRDSCSPKLKIDRQLWLKKILSIPLQNSQNKINNKTKLIDQIIPLPILINQLQAKFPANTILCTDAGFCRRFASQAWLVTQINNFFSAANIAPMGWAIGAGIGVKLAKPNNPVIVLTGDGSMAMHGLDIITAIRYRLPIFYVIAKNHGYGTIYQRLKTSQNVTTANHHLLPALDWVKFARSLGINSIKLNHLEELDHIVEQFLIDRTTFLLEVDTPLTY